MADLGGRLPTEVDSQQRFVNSAPATPSIFGALADFGSGLVGVADRVITKLDQNEASKRAAAELAAKNSAVKIATADIFTDPSVAPQPNIPPGSEGAYNSSRPLAKTAANTQAAAAQGKIDPSMAQAKSLAAFRQALAANPGHEYAVYTAFKEMGVDNMMMQQYKNAETALEADQTSQQNILHKQQEAAVTKYGYSDFFQRPPDEQAKILATVGNLEAKEVELDTATKQADLTLKNVQLTDSQRTILQKQQSSTLVQKMTDYMSGNFGNLGKIMVNLLGDPTLASQPGRLEQLQSHLMSVALPSLDVAYNAKLAPILSTLTPEDRSTIDTLYKQQKQSLVDMISGPQSVVEMNKRVLENISDKFGIDYAKSAPLIMKLQKLIGPQAVGVLLSPAIPQNSPVWNMMADELKGAIRDPSKLPSLTEFVQSLNGSIDPNSWDPEKLRAAAPAALVATNALARDSASSNGTDKQGHLALVNSIKQTAGVAVDVVPQWGFSNILMQGKALNTRGVTTALFNVNANAPDKFEAIRSWIPANTRTYQTLAEVNSGDKYYSVKLDPHTLTWSAVWNGQKVPNAARASSGFGLAEAASPGTYGGMSKPNPSTAVLEQASTLNAMLHNLSDAGAKGYDDTLGKGVSYQEAKRYFATGQMPESLKKPAAQKNGKTPEQNVDDAISHMLDFVNNLPNSSSSAPVKVSAIGPSPLAPTIAASAEKHNVPPNIAAALFHTETSGGRNNKTSDKGAMGPGQIMPATAAAYGKDVKSMTPEDNVDLALQILSDNYKRTGSWEDALAMYHSGHDLRTATVRGLSDGHMKTSDYVSSTMAAASSISPENLKKYGYVRY